MEHQSGGFSQSDRCSNQDNVDVSVETGNATPALKTSMHELFIVQLGHYALVDFETTSICTAETRPKALLPRGEGVSPG